MVWAICNTTDMFGTRFQEFRAYESMIIFYRFSIKIKNYAKTVHSHIKRHFTATLEDFLDEKNWGHIDPEFLKILHEEVILPLGKCESTSQLLCKGILQGEEWRVYSSSRYVFFKSLDTGKKTSLLCQKIGNYFNFFLV